MTTTSSAPGSRATRRATMHDVAALAGVGIKTVSRVVNGEPGVSEALVKRVTSAAAELHFLPDLSAGNLRRSVRRSGSVGLILASVDNPFCAAMHRAVEDVAERRGVVVLSASTDEEPAREKALVAAFAARRVDGLIVSGTGTDQKYLLPELRAGTPVVMVDRPPVGIGRRHRHGRQHGRGQRGHRAPAGRRSPTDRLPGGPLLNRDGEPATGGQPPCDGGRGGAIRRRLADRRPAQRRDGVRRGAPGPVRPQASHGAVHQPEPGDDRSHPRPALFGDGARRGPRGLRRLPLADLMDPAVTVVAQDPVGIGETAAERVFARLDGEDVPPLHLTVPTRLVLRGSGEIPARSGSAAGARGGGQ